MYLSVTVAATATRGTASPASITITMTHRATVDHTPTMEGCASAIDLDRFGAMLAGLGVEVRILEGEKLGTDLA